MRQLFYLFVLLPPSPGAMAPEPEREAEVQGWGSAGTASFLSSCLAPDTDPLSLHQPDSLPSVSLGCV